MGCEMAPSSTLHSNRRLAAPPKRWPKSGWAARGKKPPGRNLRKNPQRFDRQQVVQTSRSETCQIERHELEADAPQLGQHFLAKLGFGESRQAFDRRFDAGQVAGVKPHAKFAK